MDIPNEASTQLPAAVISNEKVDLGIGMIRGMSYESLLHIH